MASFIEIRPLSKEISRHTKFVLTDGWPAGRTTVEHHASRCRLLSAAA